MAMGLFPWGYLVLFRGDIWSVFSGEMKGGMAMGLVGGIGSSMKVNG